MLLRLFVTIIAFVVSPIHAILKINVVPSRHNITSIDDLRLDIEVTNTAAEDVKVFKLGSILDGSTPTQSFHVVKGGIKVAFQGVQVGFKFISDHEKTKA